MIVSQLPLSKEQLQYPYFPDSESDRSSQNKHEEGKRKIYK